MMVAHMSPFRIDGHTKVPDLIQFNRTQSRVKTPPTGRRWNQKVSLSELRKEDSQRHIGHQGSLPKEVSKEGYIYIYEEEYPKEDMHIYIYVVI